MGFVFFYPLTALSFEQGYTILLCIFVWYSRNYQRTNCSVHGIRHRRRMCGVRGVRVPPTFQTRMA